MISMSASATNVHDKKIYVCVGAFIILNQLAEFTEIKALHYDGRQPAPQSAMHLTYKLGWGELATKSPERNSIWEVY